MLVQVLNFGSNWWMRLGNDPKDPYRCTRNAAYYNSTGVRCGSKIRRHWIIPGLIRLNGVIGFNPANPTRALSKTFICDITHCFGGNRLLFRARAAQGSVPDSYLVILRSDEHGRLDISSSVCKSVFSRIIAATQLREQQETMLLMNPGDWCQTTGGFWQLHAASGNGGRAKLMRIDESSSTTIGM